MSARLLCGLTVAACAAASAAGAAAASVQAAPLVFVPTGSRWLIYDQNPEIIMPDSVADVGWSHLQIDYVRGRCRVFTELENYGNRSLGYGVALTAIAGPVAVNLTALGFTTSDDGGIPFASAFNTPMSQTFTIPAGGYSFIIRNDEVAPNYQDIFSMVADFETNETVKVNTVVYYDWLSFSLPALKAQPYVTRTDPGPDHEARVYKGLVLTSDVSTMPLLWTVDDSVPAGTALPVSYPYYDTVARQYQDLPVTAPGWSSNDNPLASPKTVASDMVGSMVLIPGWGPLDAFGCCDAGGQGSIANQANWGIVYHVRGAITNSGSMPRLLNFTLENTSCLAPIAWSSAPGQPWQAHTMWSPGNTTTLLSVPVPAGAVNQVFHVQWVLGGPSCGGEYSSFTLT